MRRRAQSNKDRTSSGGRGDSLQSGRHINVELKNIAQQEVPRDACTRAFALVVQPHLLTNTERFGGDTSDGANKSRESEDAEWVTISFVRMVHCEGREVLQGT